MKMFFFALHLTIPWGMLQKSVVLSSSESFVGPKDMIIDTLLTLVWNLAVWILGDTDVHSISGPIAFFESIILTSSVCSTMSS